jgi:hypothetical protein
MEGVTRMSNYRRQQHNEPIHGGQCEPQDRRFNKGAKLCRLGTVFMTIGIPGAQGPF